MGEGWRIAQQFVELHLRAVREFGAAVSGDGPRKRAVVVLGNHSFNICTSALDLVLLGKFDVATYLMRPLFDMPGLILATAGDTEAARRFFYEDRGLDASDARKLVERSQPDIGRALKWTRDARRTMNIYSHANSYHAMSILSLSDDGVVPEVGGRLDELRVLREAANVLRLELGVLIALGAQLSSDSHGEWWDDFGQYVASHREWHASVSARLERRNTEVARRNSQLGGS